MIIIFTGGGRGHRQEQRPWCLQTDMFHVFLLHGAIAGTLKQSSPLPSQPGSCDRREAGAVSAQGSPAAVIALPSFFTHLPTPAHLSISFVEPLRGQSGSGDELTPPPTPRTPIHPQLPPGPPLPSEASQAPRGSEIASLWAEGSAGIRPICFLHSTRLRMVRNLKLCAEPCSEAGAEQVLEEYG